jgi:hypothetical protein
MYVVESCIRSYCFSKRASYLGMQYFGASLQVQFINYSASKTVLQGYWHKLKSLPHITPILADLILILVYKALYGIGPTYTTPMNFHVPYVQAAPNSYMPPGQGGGRAFSSHTPHLWNSLPDHLCAVQTVGAFKQAWKLISISWPTITFPFLDFDRCFHDMVRYRLAQLTPLPCD